MAFELTFGGRDGTLPGITIREGEGELSLSGAVDRVDGWLKDGKLYLRVVDYKTGKKKFDPADLRAGLGLQMLLYLFTLEREGADHFGCPVVPAGVLYPPARDEIVRADRDITAEKLEALLRRETRRSGLVLGEPDVLRAMEHSALEAPCYLPLVINKKGDITDGVASAEQLGKLSRYVDNVLGQIARELRQGNIDADPWSESPQKSVCTYCAFASACYFDEGRDRRRYKRKTDTKDFWKFIDEETGKEGDHA